MTYKIEYTLIDGRTYAEYVSTYKETLNIMLRVEKKKNDDMNIRKVEVFLVERVPLTSETEIEKQFVNCLVMHYYSEVAVAIKKTYYEKLLDKINSNKFKDVSTEEVLDFVETARANAPLCSDDKYVFLFWKKVKWYKEEYEEIKLLMNFLEEIGEYDYIKVGENYDDITIELHTGKNLLYAVRTIGFH